MELRNNIKLLLDQKQTSLKTMVNLGSDFYVQAKVPDTSFIYVSVGLGFHAEMSLDEASAFCIRQEAHYNARAEALTDEAAKLKAKIKCVVAAIDELQQQELTCSSRGAGVAAVRTR